MSTPNSTYAVEKCIRTGYRGGKRHDGWDVLRVSDGKKMYWSKWKEQAGERAARLNSLEIPLTEAPELGADYWRLTESGHWLYTWEGDADDLQALRDRRAFASTGSMSC